MSYQWSSINEFINRKAELERLEQWWESSERLGLNLYGRRRVGKSWLFRAFAHKKPAVILVGDEIAETALLNRFSSILRDQLGVAPQIQDIPDLFRVLFRIARGHKLLAVIDEFPYLLPTRTTEARRILTAIQAVIEEEQDNSQLKFLLCGSHIGQMQSLLSERSPLRGRVSPLPVRPVNFEDSKAFITSQVPTQIVEHYSITGGVPRYLTVIGDGNMRSNICKFILDPNGALYNEPREILEQELRQPGIYFSILEQLAKGTKRLEEIANPLSMPGTTISKYLQTLQELQLIERISPITTPRNYKRGQYKLRDYFMRFWFRFNFPYQADLESDLTTDDLYDNIVKPALSDHVADVFEDVCRSWVRKTHGNVAQRVGVWWGNAANHLRRSGVRTSEEIDIVGLSNSKVTVVGECRWRTKQLGSNVISELTEFKIPALEQTVEISDDLLIMLFSKNGFTPAAQRLAAEDQRIKLIDLATVVK